MTDLPEPDPEQVLADYNPEFLPCRTDRHRWSRKAVYAPAARDHAERQKMCEDCMTQRFEIINTRTFERVGPVRYRYVKGYLTPRSGLVLDDFRSRLLRNEFEEASKSVRKLNVHSMPKTKKTG